MFADTPTLVSDITVWAGAAVAVLAAAAGIGRVVHNARQRTIEAMRHVIREEVPAAVVDTFPDVTRAMIREEVSHVTEPMFAGLRAELKPNGGSSFSDLINRRLDAQDARLDSLQPIADKLDPS